MADISSYSDIVRSASPGEDVRDAFIQMLILLHTMEGSIGSLDGHPASYFATKKQLNDALNKLNKVVTDNYDQAPTEDSKHLLTSGVIYDAIQAVKDVLEDINHELEPLNDLEKNLKQIEKAKKAIGDAIYTQSAGKIKKKKLSNFENYPDYVRSLTAGSSVHFTSVSFDKNGDKYANEKNEDPYTFNAYDEVSANINFKTTSYSFKNNVTNYQAPETYVGFSRISVNGSVAGSGRTGGKNGNRIDENGILEVKEITENGPASAGPELGWKTVNVNVEVDIDPDAVYTVNFYDDDPEQVQTAKVIHTDDKVPYNGRTSCPEDKIPTKTGLYFAGWAPPPINVRKNLNCIPQFTDQAPSVTEISDSWEQIVENRGGPYGIGQYKTLVLNSNYGEIRMQKVYSGEDGTTSTWVAMDRIRQLKHFYDSRPSDNWGWSNSSVRKWLNEDFLINGIPEPIKSCIVSVTKKTYEYNNTMGVKYISSVRDKVWMPSLKEILGEIPDSERSEAVDYLYTNLTPSINNTGKIQYDTFNNFISGLEPYTVEYNGIHYDKAYTTWDRTGGDGHITSTFGPKDTSKCEKGGGEWVVRSITNAIRRGAESLDINIGAFSSTGTYDYGGNGLRDHYPIIGFCL